MNANNDIPFIKKLGIKKKKEHPFCLLNERNQRRHRVRAMDTVDHSIMWHSCRLAADMSYCLLVAVQTYL
jgi:hypothetical protein